MQPIKKHGRNARRLVGAGLTIMALAGIAGCGGGGSGTSAGAGGGAAAVPLPGTAAARNLHGTVSYWTWSTANVVQKYFIAPFNKYYPNVKINLKQVDYGTYPAVLRPGLLAGTADVYDLATGALANEFGQFGMDLRPLAAHFLGSDWRSKLSPWGVAAYTQKGKMIALPLGQAAAGYMMTNMTLLNQYGLKPPTDLASWEHVCAVLKSHGKSCLLIGAKDEWVDQDVFHMIADSVAPGKFTQAVNGKLAWTDPDLLKALGIWKQLFGDGIVQPGALGLVEYQDAYNLFNKQQGAFCPCGTWQMGDMFKSEQTLVQTGAGVAHPQPFVEIPIPFPAVGGHPVPPLVDAGGTAVSAKSKNPIPAEAFDAFLHLTKPGQQSIADLGIASPSLLGVNPSTTGLVDPQVQKPILMKLTKQVQYATENRMFASSDLITAMGNALQAVAAGQQTPAQAAAALQSASPKG